MSKDMGVSGSNAPNRMHITYWTARIMGVRRRVSGNNYKGTSVIYAQSFCLPIAFLPIDTNLVVDYALIWITWFKVSQASSNVCSGTCPQGCRFADRARQSKDFGWCARM